MQRQLGRAGSGVLELTWVPDRQLVANSTSAALRQHQLLRSWSTCSASHHPAFFATLLPSARPLSSLVGCRAGTRAPCVLGSLLDSVEQQDGPESQA